MADIGGKMAKEIQNEDQKGKDFLSMQYPAFLMKQKYLMLCTHLFPAPRALIWTQVQLSSLIHSGDISKTMAPIWEKRAK